MGAGPREFESVPMQVRDDTSVAHVEVSDRSDVVFETTESVRVDELYVLTDVGEGDGDSDLPLEDGEQSDDFTVTNGTKETAVKQEAAGSIIGYVMGGVFVLVGVGLFALGVTLL